MKIYGWIVFALVILGNLSIIANNEMKSSVRVIGFIISASIVIYVLLTLFQ